MIKLVAFDWNGTILSDVTACLKADDAALIALGHKPISLNKFRETFEIPVLNFYAKLGLDVKNSPEKFEQSEKIFHETYDKLSAQAKTRLGTRKLLRYLEKHKIPAIIFSNHITGHINWHLKRLVLEKHFRHIIANEKIGMALVKRAKGEKLKSYLQGNNIQGEETLIIGDTTEEIEIAKELGAVCCAVKGGYSTSARLKAANPDYLLHDLRQIEKIISETNGHQG